MNTVTAAPTSASTRSLLLPFAGVALAGAVLVHLAIALTGGVPGLVPGVLLLGVGLVCFVLLWRMRRPLRQVRFGSVVAHTILYGAWAGTLTVHGLIATLLAGRSGGPQAAAHLLLGTPWFGVVLGMGGLWGVGLLIHAVGVVAGGGWED